MLRPSSPYARICSTMIGLHLSGCGFFLKATLAFGWNPFTSIAFTAKQLQVVDTSSPAFADGNYMIIFQILSTSTFDTSTSVPLPYGRSNMLRNLTWVPFWNENLPFSHLSQCVEKQDS